MTSWNITHRFAHYQNALWRERRLTWVKQPKNKKYGDDEEGVIHNASEDGEVEMRKPLSPIESIVGDTRRTILTSDEILKEIEKANRKGKLTSLLTTHRGDYLSTIVHGEKDLRTAEKVKNLLIEVAKGDEQAAESVRLTLEKLFTKKIQPEDDSVLQQALAEEEKKPEKKTNKQTKLERFLQRIMEIGHPLYTRLASFLTNPSIRSLPGMPSVSEAFALLRNPDRNKRFELVKVITKLTAHSSFALAGPGSAESRKKALQDLSAFLSHRFAISTEEEQPSLLFFQSETYGCIVALEGYAPAWKHDQPLDEDTALTEVYGGKAQNIGTFRSKERESKNHSIHGEGGLISRLRKNQSEEEGQHSVFGILADGLETHGWIDELPISDSEKYLCTQITLAKVESLYREISSGRFGTPTSASSVLSHVKQRFLEAVRGSMRGKEEESSHDLSLPLEDATKLKADIEKRLKEGTEKPASESVRELKLLHAWLEGSGISSPVTSAELRLYEQSAEYSRDELQREVDRLKKSLAKTAPSISYNDPEELVTALRDTEEEKRFYIQGPWKEQNDIGLYLRSSCTYQQLKEIAQQELSNQSASVLQWMQHESFPDTADELKTLIEKTYKDLQPDVDQFATQQAYAANLAVKEEKRRNREAGIFHNESDNAYLTRLLEIQALDLDDSNKRKLIEDLNLAYDEDNHARQDIDGPRIAEIETLLHGIIEAEIRLRSFDIEKQYERDYAELSASPDGGATEQSNIIPISGYLYRLGQDNQSLLIAIDTLRRVDLLGYGDPVSTADEAVKQLRYLEEQTKDPSGEAEHTLEFEHDARTRAANILDKIKDLAIPSEITEFLKNCADPESTMEASVCKTLERVENFAKKADALLMQDPEILYGEAFKVYARTHDIPEYAWGALDRQTMRPILNGDKIKLYGARDAVLTEEYQHALNMLISQELDSRYLNRVFDAIDHSKISTSFKTMAERWVKRGSMPLDVWQREVADELIAKYAVYAKYTSEHIPLTQYDLRFFRELESLGITIPGMILKEEEIRPMIFGRRAAAATGDDSHSSIIDAGGHIPGVGAGDADIAAALEKTKERKAESSNLDIPAPQGEYIPPPLREGISISDDLHSIEQLFINIDAFLTANASQRTKDNIDYLHELRQEQSSVFAEVQATDAESNEPLINRIGALHDELDEITRVIKKWDTEQSDLRDATTKRDFWHTLMNGIELVSINDMIAVYSAIKEDVQRQYKRRQQGRIGRVGKGLTDWIGSVPILKDFPYISTLSAEFQRRDKQAENEEVENWKKALQEIDSYELQEILQYPSNKDQMKAILYLLADRGRIDWNDEKFWASLNRFSNYNMPIQECKRNENLREDWLRKLISDIYGDKDLYRTLKSTNEGKIKSGKEQYHAEADRLSNMKGGLDGELEKQLKMYVLSKEKGESTPDYVQPHLYEEVLDYSIRNGKMSMEAKFYYLVQGIATGLLNKDRLGYLAGEGSGILNIFPFIDYFYGRNNTMAEIKALAERLRETNDISSNNYFRPGAKTTLWLEMEVARESSVQQRLSKGMSKRGQETDHDDMHFFIPRLDMKTVDTLTTPSGGGRPQLSPEAWENAYTGFNSYLKTFGMIVKLEDEGIDRRFTSADAQDVVRSLATFARIDGILTRRTAAGDTKGRRASLDWGRIRRRKSVNNSGETVFKERSHVDELLRKVIHEYGLNKELFEDTMLYDSEEKGSYLKEYDDKVFALTDRFPTVLTQAMQKQGIGKLKKILRDFEPHLRSHESEYTFENVLRFERKRMDQGIQKAA